MGDIGVPNGVFIKKVTKEPLNCWDLYDSTYSYGLNIWFRPLALDLGHLLIILLNQNDKKVKTNLISSGLFKSNNTNSCLLQSARK